MPLAGNGLFRSVPFWRKLIPAVSQPPSTRSLQGDLLELRKLHQVVVDVDAAACHVVVGTLVSAARFGAPAAAVSNALDVVVVIADAVAVVALVHFSYPFDQLISAIWPLQWYEVGLFDLMLLVSEAE